MSDLEQQLRATLEEKGDAALGAPPPALPADLRRRIRRRQVATVGLVTLVVSVLAAGTLVTIARTLPLPPPVRLVERPDPALDVQRTLVASGTDERSQWRVFASWRPAEEHVCIEVETVRSARMVASTCFRDPGSQPIAHLTAGFGAPYVYAGTVSDAVAEVTFESRSGATGAVPILDIRPAPGTDLRLFVAVVEEPGVVIFTARDRAGRVLLHHGAAPGEA